MNDRIAKLRAELQRVDGHAPGDGLAKHRKMATSPFVFLRGAAQLFYADLADGTLALPEALYTLPLTTVMGDCHVSNFGFLTEEGSHGDRVIFAPNDFDDACIGHAAWDLARFAVSLLLCAEHCRAMTGGDYPAEKDVSGKPAVDAHQASDAVRAFLHGYAEACDIKANTRAHHEAAPSGFDKKHILGKRYRKAVARAFGGEDFAIKSTLAKAVDLGAEPLRFRDRPERFNRLAPQDYDDVHWHLCPYADDAILDIVERLDAGTGSVNLHRYYLLVGPSECPNAEDLFLYHVVEVKQQRPAAPLFHFPGLNPTNRLAPAHLTVICQRRMQRDPDLVLDDLDWRQHNWLIRSRHHARAGIDPEHIGIGKKAATKGGFAQYAATCGRTLALAHARGDRRSTHFEAAARATLPQAEDALVAACEGYAELVRSDCRALARLEHGG